MCLPLIALAPTADSPDRSARQNEHVSSEHPLPADQHLPRGAGQTVLPPVGEGHCAFTHEQIGHAFDVLIEKTGEASR